MIRVLHIVGARPQFIKLYPLYTEMKSRGFFQKILHTGQHFDNNMSKVFFKEMPMHNPDFNLGIHSLSHGAMTGRMIEGIEQVLNTENFDYVIVYGDTNSTCAGALAAKKLKIKVVHVESGLRNFDKDMPEEINRIVTDSISDILLCPTYHCVDNLIKEGRPDAHNTGDLMYDCMKMLNKSTYKKSLNQILFTCHREENTKHKSFTEIINALNLISKKIDIIFPAHPRTKKLIKDLDLEIKFKCIPPQSYLSFLKLIKSSKYVITDSGGLVREAFFLKKPSLLLLEKPVWPELVEIGACENCASEESEILFHFNKIKDKKIPFTNKIFGDGNSRSSICNIIENYE